MHASASSVYLVHLALCHVCDFLIPQLQCGTKVEQKSAERPLYA
jgi:hypothetical protein